jgi:hypothetical protein
MPSDKQLHGTYPRTRPPLSQINIEHYETEYEKNRTGSGPIFALSAKFEEWMHKKIAQRRSKSPGLINHPALELGAGGLNHVKFESDDFPYDALEPLDELCRQSEKFPRINNLFDSFGALAEIENKETYARIFSTAVLEHLVDLPWVIAQSARLLSRKGSIFQAAIPSEGGFAWGFSWRTTTGLRYRLKTGGSYSSLMRHEHVNSASEIENIVRFFFTDVRIKRFPFPILHGSIYTYIEATNPKKTIIDEFLANTPTIRAE